MSDLIYTIYMVLFSEVSIVHPNFFFLFCDVVAHLRVGAFVSGLVSDF